MLELELRSGKKALIMFDNSQNRHAMFINQSIIRDSVWDLTIVINNSIQQIINVLKNQKELELF